MRKSQATILANVLSMSESELEAKISHAMLRDRHRLRSLLKPARRGKGGRQPQTAEQRREEFHRRLEQSTAIAEMRNQKRPVVDFDIDLPILSHREEIVSTIRENQVVVICGETGSGKSTQLPKLCLDAGFGTHGMIGHTQPRRIAARTIANRLAEELKTTVGEAVGFKIRFTDKTRPDTFIKLMTDGILLAETQGDRFLEQYEVLIIDEAHERSLNIDFLLGFLHQLLPKRPELRVIITSATIDADRFAEHFGSEENPAPIIEVSGRTFPVEVRYRPLLVEKDGQDEYDEIKEIQGIVNAVHELAAIDRGHILIFLPTERDIRETAKRLRAEKWPGSDTTEVLPLYARLSSAEQNKVFKHSDKRRIVLATNVAESSLTVPGIRYVIDTGTARISRYSPRSKVQRLPIEAVSRASADQRKGRCGRVADGICIRLFDEDDYLSRSEFTTPEIQRTNLASVILQAKSLNLGRVEEFPFIDPPRPESIREGYRTLFELGAVDGDKRLTELGRRLSRFPVDPRIARIILAADEFNCLAEVLIIAAALEIQDPRERPHDKQEQADTKHEQFVDERSDFLSYLKLWDFFHKLKEDLSHSRLRRACLQNFLSFNRMREWMEVHRQLLQLVTSTRLKPHKRKDDYDAIHQSLLTGFLSGVAYRSADHEYTGAGGIKFFLWPGSGLFATKPKWCLIEELIETRRRYGRTVGGIKPEWIEPLADHVVKRNYNDPHWHRKSGRVMAWESVTLFGLPVVQRRRVAYGPIDPEVASEVFVAEGLSKRTVDCSDKFYVHNEAIIEECTQLAAKTRRGDFLVDEYMLYRFYNERLPVEVYDLASLRKWVKSSPENRKLIRMQVSDLLPELKEESAEEFPDEVAVGSLRLPVEYEFAPGEEHDGMTMTVPQDGLAQLESGHTEWVAPGLIEEKIIAMIRSLPKSIRRGLIPAPDRARQIAEKLEHGRGDFMQQVTNLMSDIAGEPITQDVLRMEKLAPHLRMNIRVVDAEGNKVAEGRDISELRTKLNVAATAEVVDEAQGDWNRDGIVEWDFEELPKKIAIVRSGIEIAAFPTVVDQGESVNLRLLNSAELSRRKSRAGIRRLYTIKHRKALRSQVSWLPEFKSTCILAAPVIGREELTEAARDLISDRAFFRSREKLPRSAEEFGIRMENATERIGIATQDVAKLLPKIFEAYQKARLACEEYKSVKWQHATGDVKQQIKSLFADGFMLETPWMWLTEYPRYLRAIAYRMERLSSGSLEKDREYTHEIGFGWDRFRSELERLEAEGRASEELTTYRWMLEEYRVSCFAQPLGTSVTVSPQRLEKQWAKFEKSLRG